MTTRRVYPVALVTGAILTLAFPEPDVAPLAWIALVPVLYATTNAGPRRGALVWAVFALGFFGTLLSWISVVGWVAWAVLLVVQIPFLVAFGALWGWLSGKAGPLGRVALAGGAWAAFEYLRAIVPLGGFTWGQLAQSQHDVAWLLRWASIGGGIFFGGVIAAANASIAELVRAIKDRAAAGRTARIAAPIAVLVIAAAAPIAIPVHRADGPALDIALVQGNVNPYVEHDFEKDLRILNRHVALTEAIDEPVDLVVWPESAAAIDPDNPVVPPLLERAATAVDAPMIVGASEDVDEGHDYYKVMAFLVSRDGDIVERYQKTHLVPFGEYVPARNLLDWLPILDQIPRDAVPGRDETLFSVAGGTVATVLSYEGDFGSLVRRRVAAGGRLVIVATNTSTWRGSWASAQHVAFSQVRAVENGVPVVHAALSGISALVAEDGRILRSLGLYEEGTIVHTMRFATSITPYARYGEWILAVAIASSALVWWLSTRRAQRGVPGRV
ncbi:MAG: apolipoprotein N-acyltransferase [Actinobacteria bacterium]|nr:apolipoprotein N-acyltransferase [Actinomycetota bacterium]